MTATPEQAAHIARAYYNSDDADSFYAEVWGGEDIHIGLYQEPTEDIKTASRRTVDRLADTLSGIGRESTVLDIGSGYGGAARRLAERFGCRVACVNLSEAENQRHRELNASSGVAARIEVIDGSFEDLPLPDASVDAVWSQDAILHSGNRPQVFAEVDRVLKSPGQFVFTDPMRADDCPEGVLDPILARLHLADLGSPAAYHRLALNLGWRNEGFAERTEQLVHHYSRVLEETERRTPELKAKISAEYLERMKVGLRHWIDGGRHGRLCWGFFRFVKP